MTPPKITTQVTQRKRPMVERPRAIILMGVSGVGKTTTAQRLAKELGWEFRDGDSFHPPENVEKMSRGVPLNDEDRAPWLASISEWIGANLRKDVHVIVTCSALKRRYRTVLVGGRTDVRIVHLHAEKSLIADRMGRRKGHFMPPALLDSQFAALEAPEHDERVVSINVAMPPQRCVERILQVLNLR
ncbi:MAG: hypothetical protein RL291_1652 [Pseudomonadota bacterium]|jgi:carbohydrate kinase (thermoresistant glucokinase family)